MPAAKVVVRQIPVVRVQVANIPGGKWKVILYAVARVQVANFLEPTLKLGLEKLLIDAEQKFFFKSS